jgi:hypothetical protein
MGIISERKKMKDDGVEKKKTQIQIWQIETWWHWK